VNAEFNWWLLIVGVVVGGALTWLVLADLGRRDLEIEEDELRAEAGWLARNLDDPRVDADVVERVLRGHRRYLGFPPPDALVDPAEMASVEQTPAVTGDAEA
jgi:hypothetical protein